MKIYPWQQSQWQRIQQQRQAARLPHALLLSGAEGMGKQDFAQQLAASLLCQQPDAQAMACGQCAACQLLDAGTHPDLFVLQAEEPGKAIKVDSVRRLSADLSLSSQLGGFKVALIVDAHDMNINAANSLLKTLEEPSSDAVILLVSSKPQQLPVTIRSRCQRLNFCLPNRADALSWLQAQGVERADELLSLAHGAPLLAQQFQQQELLEHHQQLISALLAVARKQPLVEQAAKLHQRPFNYMLNWLYDWVEDLIKLRQCGENASLVHQSHQAELMRLAPRCSLRGLYDYLDQLLQCRRLQSIPLNSQLLWEDLLLSWNRQIK